MNGLETVALDCPCCGAPISVVVDCSLAEQAYVEDREGTSEKLLRSVWLR